ncbi:DUF2125 domain-containing protein [Ruegeria sp. 2205SS24-7]|uniref:DUF2125 domain-containing protein n=1 Tax=Ruegeria discodermiae TaxID=3064389 RepID=UPI0027415CD0|nr:DUF2125 domain-containing protein [Ruegeria sp. 2205SS24-7]MDP5218273.1 DUF2125 domain-containing protein [Ruegeria sp. 2205SS24-7]
MSTFLRRSCGAAFVYVIAVQGAAADLTAQDVWSDWQAYMSGMGYEVNASEATSGDVTTITDLAMTMELPEEEGSVVMTIPEMTLTENGDGTVAVDLPASFPLTVDFDGPDAGDVRIELTYSHDNLAMTVSGDPDDMNYDYAADSVTVELASLTDADEALPPDALKMLMTVSGVTGTSQMKIGEMRDVAQTMKAATLSYNIEFEDPDNGENALIAGEMEGLGFTGSGVLPKEWDAADYQSLMESGFNFAGGFTFAKGSTNISGVAEGSPFTLASSSQGGAFDIAMTGSQVKYDVKQNDTKLAVTSGDLPFPLEMEMTGAGVNFEFPVQAGDTPQPFAFGMSLTDFTMSDILWSMFDPAGALPRDPATVVLDTEGTATVLVDFMDPAVAETLEATEAMPGQLETLNIKQLLVSMVGAKLSGTGAFAFDNENTEEFGGMPAPSGVANLELTGANALIDKLIGMGLMADSDAMGARMMMGMLAVPGDAPDTLTSEIEINKQGHITANGQRIK